MPVDPKTGKGTRVRFKTDDEGEQGPHRGEERRRAPDAARQE